MCRRPSWLAGLASFLLFPVLAQAQHHAHGPRADDHAPIGVMGDHMHHEGEVMLSYRYSRMNMNGNRDGHARVSTRDVLTAFPVAPYDMDMEMHMLGVMWAPHEAVTLMAMVPWVRLDMKHTTRMGVDFVTRSKGIGDVRISGMVRLLDHEGHHVHLNAGVSAPTGKLTFRDDTPAGTARLPYPMQIGSGTWDLLPGLTWTWTGADWSGGAQVNGVLRTGINDRGYRLGHRFGATSWVARRIANALSVSFRLDYGSWRNVRGDEDELIRGLVPTADPHRRAGRRLDGLLGLNFVFTDGPLRGHRLALEGGRPLLQSLDGPQLEADWRVVAGWQYAF